MSDTCRAYEVGAKDNRVNILVINCGSSSIKVDVLDADSGERHISARLERVGKTGCTLRLNGGDPEQFTCRDHGNGLEQLIPTILDRANDAAIAAVAHRVVHGGERFDGAVEIDEEIEAAIESLSPLAPLHNPVNLAGIRVACRLLPQLPHVAVFDTSFHSTMPKRARAYALPAELRNELGIRRYGFHGPSHAWVSAQVAKHLEEDVRHLRTISCHLGSGCSIAAVEYGRSVETSMGMTPLEGVVMGTRSGDLDPGVILAFLRHGMSPQEIDETLNTQSGLLGLSGISGDLRDIEAGADDGNERCRLAIQVFCHRVRKYIGAYAAVMGGVDAIAFTAGIGENSARVRQTVCQRLDFLGARLDEHRNREARVERSKPVAEISQAHSRTRLMVIASDEAHEMAREAARVVGGAGRVADERTINIAISARHVHLTGEAVEALFGAGHQLTPHKDLSQPGQFACKEELTVIGPKRSLERVRVIGPARARCQVEISRSDEFHLGLDAPIRCSGDLDNTPGITLQGPAGSVDLDEGVICAQRHIHMTPEDAQHFGSTLR